jgi:sortase A
VIAYSLRQKLCIGLLLLVGAGFFTHSYWIGAKAVAAQILLERAWSQTLRSQKPVKAWSWADTWPVAKIEVPRLGKSVIVLESASGEAMAFGPGHVSQTPYPGQKGTSIIAAHRDTHFAFLKDLALGDEILITNREGKEQSFIVSETKVVAWNQSGIDPLEGRARVALVTCYPFEAITPGPLRYIVYASKRGQTLTS